MTSRGNGQFDEACRSDFPSGWPLSRKIPNLERGSRHLPVVEAEHTAKPLMAADGTAAPTIDLRWADKLVAEPLVSPFFVGVVDVVVYGPPGGGLA